MGFFDGLRFLTILPLPQGGEAGPEKIGKSTPYFPLVGLFLGLVLVGFDRLFGLVMPEPLVNALLIAVLIMLTGAMHMDGLMDTCDGAMVRNRPEDRLRIMADSHAGSFGVIAAIMIVLLKYTALLAVPGDLRTAALIAMPVMGRWAMVFALAAFPYARAAGKGLVFKQQTSRLKLALATAVMLVIVLLVAGLSGAALIAAVWLPVWGLAAFLRHRLGGLTGDCYGAVNEVGEVLVLILLPLLAGVLSTHFLGPWEILNI